MEKFTVIVAGSRNYHNYRVARQILDMVLENKSKTHEIEINCGMADGADMLGYTYGDEKGYKVNRYYADWNRLGKQAGYVRNQKMADTGNALIAFWDGESSGTGNMIDIAIAKGIPVIVYNFISNELDNL